MAFTILKMSFSILCICFSAAINAQEKDLASQFVEIKVSNDTINYSYFIGKYEVSVADYKFYLDALGQSMPEPPEYGWENDSLPMIGVSYDEAQSYCNWLSDVYQISFKIPTEEQWAIAAGTKQENIKSNSERPHCINCMVPNQFGAYGLNGNVWEWTSTTKDNEFQIIRGGSYIESSNELNVNKSSALSPSLQLSDVGFRLLVEENEMRKHLFSEEVKELLSKLFPEYTNIRVEPYGIFIDDIEMFWGEDEFQIVYLNEAEFNLAFCCIDEINEQAEINSKKAFVFDFDKDDLPIAKQLEHVINKRDVSIFRN
jgi:hypothetical protein